MIGLKRLHLKNVVYFKDATFDLDHPGITTIYGDNRMTNSKVKKSNGSGKSLLPSSIPNLRYDALPVSGNLPKAKLRKELLTGADSFIGLDLTADGHDWSFSKASKGSSVEYDVLRDGRPKKVRRQGYAQEMMAKYMPWTEEEFFTTIYLDSRRPAYIRFGSASSRMAFFTQLFGLDNYDDTRKLLKREADELKASTKRLAAVDVELSEFAEDLNAVLKALIKDQDYYQGELDVILPKMEDLQAKIHSVNSVAEQAQNIEKLVEVCHKNGLRNLTEKRILKLLDNLKQDRAELREQLKTAHAYAELKAQYDKQQKRLSSLGYEGESLATIKSKIKALIETLTAADEKIEALSAELADANAENRRLVKPEKVEEVKKPKTKKTVAELEEALADANAEARAAVKEVQRVNKLIDAAGADCTCPTCDTKLSRKDLTALLARYEEAADVAGVEAESVEADLIAVKAYAKWEQTSTAYAEWKEKSVALVKTITFHNAKLSDLKKEHAANEDELVRLKDIRAILKDLLDKPEKPDVLDDVQDSIDSMSDDISVLTANSSLASILSMLVDKEGKLIKSEDLTANLPKLRKKYREWVEYSQGIQADIVENTTKIAETRAAIERRDELIKEKAELEAALEDAPVYDLLLDAFSQKGIKTLLLNSICSRLQKTMNKYAPLVFAEDFTFEFSVKSNTDFSIMVTRNSGKRKITSDIRNLSGAEGRQFDCLFVLAMLPMLPSRRRCNVIILDEPTTNMDEAAKDLFINSFIPKLATVVPSVIVITPLSQEVYPHARRVKIIKERGVSRIEIDPSTIVKED